MVSSKSYKSSSGPEWNPNQIINPNITDTNKLITASQRFKLAIQYLGKGNLNEAEKIMMELIKMEPDNPELLHYLGIIKFKQKNYAFSVKFIQQALYYRTNWAEAYHNLGSSLIMLGDFNNGIINFKKAIELKPSNPEALVNLGNMLYLQKRYDEAEIFYKKAIKINPIMSCVYSNIGFLFMAQGKFEEGEKNCQKETELNPRMPMAFYNLGLLLMIQSKFKEAIINFKKTLELSPKFYGAYSSILLSMQYQDGISNIEWQKELNNFKNILKNIPRFNNYENELNIEKKLRIGYLSADFFTHSCAWFIKPLLASPSNRKIEIFCYSDVNFEDDLTLEFKNMAEHWHDTSRISDQSLAEQIINDKIDILVELTGHVSKNRWEVLAIKPAPIQVSYLGYQASTGLSVIDYKLSDRWLAPDNIEEYFSETLWHLNRPVHCYSPPEITPPIGDLPVLTNGYITFGSFNNFCKISEKTIELWSEVLSAIENSKIILKSNISSQSSAKVIKDKLLSLFEKYHIEPERINFISSAKNVYEHLEYYNQMDIALDTFPYNGATTSLEALWMGVPVITLFGNKALSRYTYSFLQELELSDLATDNTIDFVKIAVNLKHDVKRLDYLKKELRNKLKSSRLLDSGNFAMELENAYRKMWEIWCLKNKLTY